MRPRTGTRHDLPTYSQLCNFPCVLFHVALPHDLLVLTHQRPLPIRRLHTSRSASSSHASSFILRHATPPVPAPSRGVGGRRRLDRGDGGIVPLHTALEAPTDVVQPVLPEKVGSQQSFHHGPTGVTGVVGFSAGSERFHRGE